MKSFVIIGCGRFGKAVAKTLASLDKEVMAVDADFDVVQEMAEYVTTSVQADVMEEMALKELGISNFDCAIVAIASDIQASVMATVTCKELGVPYIVAKSLSDMHAKVLTKIGADKIIFPERDMGVRLGHSLTSANIIDYIQVSQDYGILEIAVDPEWVDKSFADLKFRNRYSVNVVAIRRGSQTIISPSANDKLKSEDVLVVIGANEDISKLESRYRD